MGRNRSWVVRITTAECAVELRCSAGGFCCAGGFGCVALLCGFAVECEDSEDTGFCPLRIMWCAPEQPRVLESAKQAASETFSFATNRNYSISHCFVIR